MTSADLYRRMAANILASWEACATGAPGASVYREPGVSAAIFPHAPERAVYNNALLERDLDAVGRAAALETLKARYAEAGVHAYAAWAHESDRAMIADLEGHGYALDTSTRAMAMALEDLAGPRISLDLGRPDWAEHLRMVGVPEGWLRDVDPGRFHVLIARHEGVNATTGLAYDHDGDCGIYNLGTAEHARRRGLGAAVTAKLLHDGRARGCTTASLQSTRIAEGVYASVGFRDLGRFLEYVPTDRTRTARAA